MSQNKETSRKLLEKQQRRLAEESRINEARKAARRRNLVTAGVVVLVLVVVVALVARDRSQPIKLLGAPASEAGCTEIEHPALQDADHIEEGTPHPPYSSDPPTSGPHYATPADAGFYPTALPTEQVIHNLEHGQIVIWYRPDLGTADLELLEDITRDEPLATIAIPYAALEGNAGYALTAWGSLQFCEQVSGEAIAIFRALHQGRGPEQVGVPVFDPPSGLDVPDHEGPLEEPGTTPPPDDSATPEPARTKKGSGDNG